MTQILRRAWKRSHVSAITVDPACALWSFQSYLIVPPPMTAIGRQALIVTPDARCIRCAQGAVFTLCGLLVLHRLISSPLVQYTARFYSCNFSPKR